MARPAKTKIDYFPIDCCDDSRMKLVELKHGLVAYAVYVKLLQKIYGNKGYYMNWDEDILLLFSGEYSLPVESVDAIVGDMLNRGIFHKELFEKYGILTSREIQEQYLFVIAKRKNRELDERFRLINSEKTVVNSVDNTHSIVEDSIVKDSISEDRRENKKETASPTPTPRGEMNNVLLTEEEYCRLKDKYPDADRLINNLSLYLASTGKSYSSHYATLVRWAEEEGASYPTQTAPCNRDSTLRYHTPQSNFRPTAAKTKYPPQKTENSNSSFDIDEFYEIACKQNIRSCLK